MKVIAGRLEIITFIFYLQKKIVEGESNDGSIVLYTKLGGLRWLFTGDLEADGEENLLKKNPSLSSRCSKGWPSWKQIINN